MSYRLFLVDYTAGGPENALRGYVFGHRYQSDIYIRVPR